MTKMLCWETTGETGVLRRPKRGNCPWVLAAHPPRVAWVLEWLRRAVPVAAHRCLPSSLTAASFRSWQNIPSLFFHDLPRSGGPVQRGSACGPPGRPREPSPRHRQRLPLGLYLAFWTEKKEFEMAFVITEFRFFSWQLKACLTDEMSHALFSEEEAAWSWRGFQR